MLIPQLRLLHVAILIILAAALSLAIAWFTQYGLGFAPCQLCLKQRWPYYLAIGLGLIMLVLIRFDKDGAVRLALALTGLLMLAGAGLAAYHSGVEWKFWPGPSSCAPGNGFSGNVGDFMAQLKQARIVPCDTPPFRIFGLSPAGYNVLYSIGFAAFCFLQLRRSRS